MHYAFLCLLRLSHDLQTFLNVLMHVDMFSGMYTSQGSGDILVRMCGSWEKIMVTYLLKHVVRYRNLNTVDPLLRSTILCGQMGKSRKLLPDFDSY